MQEKHNIALQLSLIDRCGLIVKETKEYKGFFFFLFPLINIYVTADMPSAARNLADLNKKK